MAGLTSGSRAPSESPLYRLLITGVGFLSDAYDLFVINTVLAIMKHVYRDDVSGESAIAVGALVGAIVGQVTFGALADIIGRKKGFILTLLLVIVGAGLSATSVRIGSLSVFAVLAAWRFILGIGIGGEYPLSATISSESSETANRGRKTAAVFSMQGFGMLLAPLLALLLLSMFPGDDLDIVWRILLGLGAVPGLCMIYSRCKMRETDRYAKEHASKQLKWQLAKKNLLPLLGTAGSWFLFDIAFYANALFSTTIIEGSGLGKGEDARSTLIASTRLDAVLVLMGIPGYLAATLLIDKVGRKPLQLGGFIVLSVLYLIIGLAVNWLEANPFAFFAFYGLTFFVSNMGPNTTTFVLPSETFPTPIRATFHGISAACGKAGAAVGGAFLKPILASSGLSVVMYCCAAVALAGAFLTWAVVVETKGRSLEAISGSLRSTALDEAASEGALRETATAPLAVVGLSSDDGFSDDDDIEIELPELHVGEVLQAESD